MIKSTSHTNSPELWLSVFPKPLTEGHKYDRGSAIIFGAPELTGATRLAASACSRIGAGLTTVIAKEKADIYRETLPADIMVKENLPEEIDKITVVLGGSGGIKPENLELLLNNHCQSARVFDADAIPTEENFRYLDDNCVLTPHHGEFSKAFPNIKGKAPDMALHAASVSGAYIILKGSQTIIAAPDGNFVINDHASPYLAIAGTGDVLAGMVAGLIAQGMPVFEACCAATWLHGEAALRFGPGLVASDIPDMMPQILRELLE
jgi:hydroxyethylthiazole kinase-like uncharacterized protein yjeF